MTKPYDLPPPFGPFVDCAAASIPPETADFPPYRTAAEFVSLYSRSLERLFNGFGLPAAVFTGREPERPRNAAELSLAGYATRGWTYSDMAFTSPDGVWQLVVAVGFRRWVLSGRPDLFELGEPVVQFMLVCADSARRCVISCRMDIGESLELARLFVAYNAGDESALRPLAEAVAARRVSLINRKLVDSLPSSPLGAALAEIITTPGAKT